MNDEPDYAKAEAFRQYVKACRLAEFHHRVRSPKLTNALSKIAMEFHERRARTLVAAYPDFPAFVRDNFPRLAHLVIDE